YISQHEWVEVGENDGVVGITERIQLEYGNIIFIELPSGDEYEQDEPLGRVEVTDGNTFPIYAPATGEIKEINTTLEEDPDLINHSPEGDGWICRISIESPRELDVLMDADAYIDYEEEELDNEYMDEEDFYDEDEAYDYINLPQKPSATLPASNRFPILLLRYKGSLCH
ncbi:Glycine cleavage system H protein, partial [Geodia barretti]